MSSMSPVFSYYQHGHRAHLQRVLLPVHETGDRESAILNYARCRTPTIYTDLMTAAGFACLAAGHIIPVRCLWPAGGFRHWCFY